MSPGGAGAGWSLAEPPAPGTQPHTRDAHGVPCLSAQRMKAPQGHLVQVTHFTDTDLKSREAHAQVHLGHMVVELEIDSKLQVTNPELVLLPNTVDFLFHCDRVMGLSA